MSLGECDDLGHPFTRYRLGIHTFSVIQLLDEICDGMPFTTEANLIEDIIPRPNLVQKVVTAVTGSSILPTSLPPAIITRHPWRRENPRVIQNEVEVDQSEEINCTLDR